MILCEQHGAQSYPNEMRSYHLVYTSWHMLCAGVLYKLALAVLGCMILNEQHGAQNYPNGMRSYHLVYTSWHMLCAGVLYELALACAWMYDSM